MKQTRVLVYDWETTGLPPSPSMHMRYDQGAQGIELGAVVLDITQGWKQIAEFSTRVRFMDHVYPYLTWSDKAETIHGIARRDLESAPGPADAYARFENFLSTNFTDGYPILTAGQNPWFDRYFVEQLALMAERPLPRFSHRMIDATTLGIIMFGIDNSEELFNKVCGVKRDTHTGLQDSILTGTVIRTVIEALATMKSRFR